MIFLIASVIFLIGWKSASISTSGTTSSKLTGPGRRTQPIGCIAEITGTRDQRRRTSLISLFNHYLASGPPPFPAMCSSPHLRDVAGTLATSLATPLPSNEGCGLSGNNCTGRRTSPPPSSRHPLPCCVLLPSSEGWSQCFWYPPPCAPPLQ